MEKIHAYYQLSLLSSTARYWRCILSIKLRNFLKNRHETEEEVRQLVYRLGSITPISNNRKQLSENEHQNDFHFENIRRKSEIVAQDDQFSSLTIQLCTTGVFNLYLLIMNLYEGKEHTFRINSKTTAKTMLGSVLREFENIQAQLYSCIFTERVLQKT